MVLTAIALFLPAIPSWAGVGGKAAGGAQQTVTPGRPVPQHTYVRGQRGYNIVPARKAHFKASTGPRKPFFRGATRTPAAAPNATTTAPAKTTTPVIGPAPELYSNLNRPGLTAADSGGASTPPDSTGAIGPSNYVGMDNSNVAVYDRNLNVVSSASLDNFLGVGSSVPFCDPQIQWDSAAGRWLMSFLYCNLSDTLNQGVFVGWSATADPSNLSVCNSATGCPGWTGWCGFVFGNGSDLLDFDKLGHSTGYVVVGGNIYDVSKSASNPPFVSAGLEWAPMPANGDQSCKPPASAGTNSIPLMNGDGLTQAFTPVPVNETSTSSDVWIVSAYDAAGNVPGSPTPQNRLSTWDLNSAGTLVAHADITVNTYSFPSSAAQLGSTYPLDTSDARLTQAVGSPSAGIWTQHTVADSSARSEVDWYELAQSGPNLTLVQQGSIDTASSWTFNGAISPRWDGQGAAIVYNVSSTTSDPSIVVQVRRAATPSGTFDAGRTTVATSSAADTDFSCIAPYGPPCRWGDYSGATPDPVHQTIVWATSEFNTAAGSSPAWTDENFAVHVAQAPAPIAAPVARSDGRGDAAVNWSGPQFEPDACPSFVLKAYVGGIFAGLSITVTGLASAAQFRGLTAGTTYTFTVTPANCGVPAPSASPQSNGVAIGAGISQATPAPVPSRGAVNPAPTPSPQPR